MRIKGEEILIETKIYGHRGSKGTHPENTLISFKEAIKHGVDGLEIDVHMTKDQEIVVIHDETLDRTTNGNGFIKDYSLQQIKQYSVGTKFTHLEEYDENWELERVPTLQEVLELLSPYNIELNIELKTTKFTYEGIEEKVLSIVEKYGNGCNVIYSAFHFPTLLRIKNLDKSAKIAWLLDKSIPHPNDYIECMNLEALHLEKSIILSDSTKWKDYFRRMRAWTVNESSEIKDLLDLNIESIITDFPKEAIRLRNEKKSYQRS